MKKLLRLMEREKVSGLQMRVYFATKDLMKKNGGVTPTYGEIKEYLGITSNNYKQNLNKVWRRLFSLGLLPSKLEPQQEDVERMLKEFFETNDETLKKQIGLLLESKQSYSNNKEGK